ncbi:MAG: ACT domain-containing protein [Terriglobales bacterium]
MLQKLQFRRLPGGFAVCRLPPDAAVPVWADGTFTSITRTTNELSIVCPLEQVPADHKPDIRWCCFQLAGPFAFSQVGILASLIDPLAASGIPIFAISTYDTDYVLVGEEFAERAVECLKAAGHQLI